MVKTPEESAEERQYLSARYEAALEEVGGRQNKHVDRITGFIAGAEWDRKYQKRSQPVSAATGPHRLTVGDLSAAMIGSASIRVEHEGATVQGTLNNLEIETRVRTMSSADGVTYDVVIGVEVSVTIGQIEFHNLRVGHPAEVLS